MANYTAKKKNPQPQQRSAHIVYHDSHPCLTILLGNDKQELTSAKPSELFF
jgi:hypothetical protein